MAKEGHLRLSVKPISRSSRHSVVAKAAYNSAQKLKQEKTQLASIPLPVNREDTETVNHRKALNKGSVGAELRRILESLDTAPIKPNETNPKKQTKKEKLLQKFKAPIFISENATVTKINRYEWLVTDGKKSFVMRETVERAPKDSKTGKRPVKSRNLDIYGEKTHDFRTKETVKEAFLMLPENAPEWMQKIASHDFITANDRGRIWNEVENAEIHYDARVGLNFELTLLRDLSYEENIEAVRSFIQKEFTDKGMIADIAIHDAKASDGGRNLHAHAIVSTRTIGKDGKLEINKDDDLLRDEKVYAMRVEWASILNEKLESSDTDTRVNPQSYEARGIEKLPQIHLGKEAHNLENRGEESRRGNRLRVVHYSNAVIDRIRDKVRGARESYGDIIKRVSGLRPATGENPQFSDSRLWRGFIEFLRDESSGISFSGNRPTPSNPHIEQMKRDIEANIKTQRKDADTIRGIVDSAILAPKPAPDDMASVGNSLSWLKGASLRQNTDLQHERAQLDNEVLLINPHERVAAKKENKPHLAKSGRGAKPPVTEEEKTRGNER